MIDGGKKKMNMKNWYPFGVPVFAVALAFALPLTGAADESSDSGDLVEFEIELPRPMFEGTPQNLRNLRNLQPERQNPREPLLVPPGTKNVALGKPVTASDPYPLLGELEMITEGYKEGGDGNWVELSFGLQWVQVDLEDFYDIHGIGLWHYHSEGRVYRDVIVQVADDPDFITNVRTLFNNDYDNSAGLGIGEDLQYVDSFEGKLIRVDEPHRARYVRFYSQGNTSNDRNHYTEVEVYATPAN